MQKYSAHCHAFYKARWSNFTHLNVNYPAVVLSLSTGWMDIIVYDATYTFVCCLSLYLHVIHSFYNQDWIIWIIIIIIRVYIWYNVWLWPWILLAYRTFVIASLPGFIFDSNADLQCSIYHPEIAFGMFCRWVLCLFVGLSIFLCNYS